MYKLKFLLIFIFSGFMMLALSEAASAHAIVTETSLKTQPVKPGQPAAVMLHFNANVVLKLSKVFLVSAGDVYQPVEIALGSKKGELQVLLPALQAGDYAIKYKVFAADGHLTENAIRFHVNP